MEKVKRYAHALSGIVAIDGNDGVGKTTLALRNVVGGTVVSLDEFVPKNRGGYVPHLDALKLRSALQGATRPVIIEGVCVLAILEKAACDPDVLIYVKRVMNDGYWPS